LPHEGEDHPSERRADDGERYPAGQRGNEEGSEEESVDCQIIDIKDRVSKAHKAFPENIAREARRGAAEREPSEK
jgi:hypothetical protein